MRILLLAYYYPPLVSGGSQRPAQWAKWLTRLGNDVWIVTHSYRKPTTIQNNIIRVYDPAHIRNQRGRHWLQWLFFRLQVEMKNRLGIYDSIFRPWGKNVLKMATEIMNTAKPDVVIATYPPIETMEISLHLSAKNNVPLVADFRDGLLFEPIEAKRLKINPCIQRHYFEVESRIATSAALIFTVSPYISDYLKNTYQLPNVHTLPNSFDPDDSLIDSILPPLESGKFHIVHTGRLALSDSSCAIGPLVDAMTHLLAKTPEIGKLIRLHFIGTLKKTEIVLLKKMFIQGIALYHGERNRHECLAWQRKADLLLLVTSSRRQSVATTKLYEYLAAQKPILALTGRTFAAEIIEKTNSGWIVPAHDSLTISAILEKIIRNPEIRAARTCTAERIQIYSASRQMQQLNDILRQIHSGQTPVHEV